MRQMLKKPWMRMVLISALLGLLISLPRKYLRWHYQDSIHKVQDAPLGPVAIVFGAGLHYDGRPSAVLTDRVAVGAALYHSGRVGKLLMSGSTRPPDYNEPQAMRALAVQLGVPAEDILIDTGGTRTFLTCLRAQEQFKVRHALLVSQRFHLPRSLAICNGLGIQAMGVSADLRFYNQHAQRYWELREIPATLIALWDTGAARARTWLGYVGLPCPRKQG